MTDCDKNSKRPGLSYPQSNTVDKLSFSSLKFSDADSNSRDKQREISVCGRLTTKHFIVLSDLWPAPEFVCVNVTLSVTRRKTTLKMCACIKNLSHTTPLQCHVHLVF